MKQLLIGFIMGLVVTSATAAYATDTIPVQVSLFRGDVTVEGTKGYTALLYGEKVYVPIRKLAEDTGMKLSYTDDPQRIEVYQTMQVLDYELLEELELGGIKLMKPEEELVASLGKGELRHGCFGCGLYTYYPDKKVTVSTTTNLPGWKHKVVRISSKNTSDQVLGVSIGEELASAEVKLKKRGFMYKEDTDEYVKGDLYVHLKDQDQDRRIEELTIGIHVKTSVIH